LPQRATRLFKIKVGDRCVSWQRMAIVHAKTDVVQDDPHAQAAGKIRESASAWTEDLPGMPAPFLSGIGITAYRKSRPDSLFGMIS
jgi:hypothetical protein